MSKVAVAESVTGGLIAHLITKKPGASQYFLGGVVAYSNQAKIELCKVKLQTLQAFGAVSEQVALEMAQGVLSLFHADVALATTGIAGPTGGSASKPIGMVCYAIAYKDKKPYTWTHFHQEKTRLQIQKAASQRALEVLNAFI